MADARATWVVGYQDEGWWSRLAHARLHTWSDTSKDDPDPKALCCSGLLRDDTDKLLLRCVDGRPVSHSTVTYLAWVCQRLAADRKDVVVLVWDTAAWHRSRAVLDWIRAHNRLVVAHRRQGEAGVQIIPCWLPSTSPWLNPIEPYWIHGKRNIVEPTRTLTAQEVIERICGYVQCEHFAHLKQQVA
jgi:transposase